MHAGQQQAAAAVMYAAVDDHRVVVGVIIESAEGRRFIIVGERTRDIGGVLTHEWHLERAEPIANPPALEFWISREEMARWLAEGMATIVERPAGHAAALAPKRVTPPIRF